MFRNFSSVVDAVEGGFGSAAVLVIGDLMLDRYMWGNVDRISPEAPVPVLQVRHSSASAGGAGNVAMNLTSLGCEVRIAGIVGTDEERDLLLGLLHQHRISTQAVVELSDRPTTVKTRIIGGHQQMLRLDKEDTRCVSDSQVRSLLDAVDRQFEHKPSVVVLSDYGKGVSSPFLCEHVIKRARAEKLPILVDPKGCDYTKYVGATALSPNREELSRVMAAPFEDLPNLLQQGQKLRAALDLDFIALTLSELGIALLEPTGISNFPALAREVFDVSGAGDTVIATMAASLQAGLHLHDIVQLANLAAGVVVGKLGTAPITREELLAALVSERERDAGKIASISELLNRIARWRSAGERIVFTNGCFDILHAGHINLVQHARREGDRLIVGLNTDRSVASLKGPTRPIVGEQERARVVAALGSVDAVVVFDQENPLSLIKAIRPDVLVKGGDYTENEIVGAAEVNSWGGKVTIVPLVKGISSSEVIRRAAEDSLAARATTLTGG